MTTRNRYAVPTMVAIAFAGALAATSTALAGAAAGPGPGEPTLAEVRSATERFRDVKVALAEGYIRDPFDLCDNAAMMGKPAALGAMGVHYFRPDLLGVTEPPSPRVNGVGTHTDFRKPAILIYEPQKDGNSGAGRCRKHSVQGGVARIGMQRRRRSTASCDSMRTTRTPRSTRPTCSNRTSIATCGSIVTTRPACSRRSIRRSAARITGGRTITRHMQRANPIRGSRLRRGHRPAPRR